MKNKVLFLDRDGVINVERGEYTWKKEEFYFVELIFENLKIAQNKGYLIIVISNQGGVGKELYSLNDLSGLTNYMKLEFEKKSVTITDFLFCPHHPDFNGKCICRKPDSLLFEKAIAKYNADIHNSIMIGDKERDIQAAEKCGIRSFLIAPNTSIEKIVSLLP